MKLRTIACSLAALGLGLAACGSPEGTGDAPAEGTDATLPDCPRDALAQASGPVEVTFWYAETAAAEQAVLGLIDKYNSSQDKVKVVGQNQVGTGIDTATLQKYQGAISSNQLPDLVQFYEREMVPAIDTNTLLPAEACLSDSELDDIRPAVRSHYTVHDSYWPGYVGVTQPLTYFNAEAFTNAGLDPAKPPRTLDDVYTAAKALKAAGVESPVSLQADTAFHITSMVTAAGESVLDHNNGRDGDPESATFDNPVTHQVFEWLVKMKDEGLLAPFQGQDNLLAMASLTSAITFGDTGQASGIAAFLSQGSPPGLTLASAPLPSAGSSGASTVVSGPGLFVVNKSTPEEQAASWDFMTFLQQKEQGLELLQLGSYLPFQQSVGDDAAVEAFFDSDDLAARLGKPGWESLQTIDVADKPGPLLIEDVTKVLDVSVQELMFNDASADSAIAQANSELEAVIKQYWG